MEETRLVAGNKKMGKKVYAVCAIRNEDVYSEERCGYIHEYENTPMYFSQSRQNCIDWAEENEYRLESVSYLIGDTKIDKEGLFYTLMSISLEEEVVYEEEIPTEDYFEKVIVEKLVEENLTPKMEFSCDAEYFNAAIDFVAETATTSYTKIIERLLTWLGRKYGKEFAISYYDDVEWGALRVRIAVEDCDNDAK